MTSITAFLTAICHAIKTARGAKGWCLVDAAMLMEKLLEIERAVGVVDPLRVRRMVLDAESALIEMQQGMVRALTAS